MSEPAQATNDPGGRPPRLIKRYANRKMYDTARSCYITLEEVAEIVRAGEEVRVIDNKSKEDLTEVTLAQALLSSERRKRGSVSLDGLRNLFAHGGELLQAKVGEPVARAASEAERTVEKWKSEAEHTIGRLVKSIDEGEDGDGGEAAAAHPAPAAADEAEADGERGDEPAAAASEPRKGADKEAAREESRPRQPRIVEQTQRAYDELQHRIDDRVRLLVSALTHPPPRDEELVELRARIETLEARVAQLEAQSTAGADGPQSDD